MDDAAAELRPRRERVVHVKRIPVSGDLDEPPDVFVREGLGEAGALTGLEVLDPGGGWRRSQEASRTYEIPIRGSVHAFDSTSLR